MSVCKIIVFRELCGRLETTWQVDVMSKDDRSSVGASVLIEAKKQAVSLCGSPAVSVREVDGVTVGVYASYDKLAYANDFIAKVHFDGDELKTEKIEV